MLPWHSSFNLHLHHWHLLWAPIGVPAATLVIQLPADVTRKAADDDPVSEASATYVGGLDGILVSWLQPGPFGE